MQGFKTTTRLAVVVSGFWVLVSGKYQPYTKKPEACFCFDCSYTTAPACLTPVSKWDKTTTWFFVFGSTLVHPKQFAKHSKCPDECHMQRDACFTNLRGATPVQQLYLRAYMTLLPGSAKRAKPQCQGSVRWIMYSLMLLVGFNWLQWICFDDNLCVERMWEVYGWLSWTDRSFQSTTTSGACDFGRPSHHHSLRQCFVERFRLMHFVVMKLWWAIRYDTAKASFVYRFSGLIGFFHFWKVHRWMSAHVRTVWHKRVYWSLATSCVE